MQPCSGASCRQSPYLHRSRATTAPILRVRASGRGRGAQGGAKLQHRRPGAPPVARLFPTA
eukprot:9487416-Pyramimonas_sp.AAC.1